MEFQPWPKIYRLYRECIITEKIDGTNAQIGISMDGTILAGSRTRWLTKEKDNFGFCAWVSEHRDELMQLGSGHHYGEWWGKGIQRGYGLQERRFSLFNVSRFGDVRPSCCDVVPVLYRGTFHDDAVAEAIGVLRGGGSVAVPGWENPEGLVIYHEASGTGFKVTLDGDGHKCAR